MVRADPPPFPVRSVQATSTVIVLAVCGITGMAVESSVAIVVAYQPGARALRIVASTISAARTPSAPWETTCARGLTLGVFYASNVEQYLEYTPTFRRNMLALDVREDAVVVRTLGWRAFGYAPGEQYHYNVQGAPSFAAWMRYSEVRRLADLLRFRTKTVERGLSVLDQPPDVSLPRPEIAAPVRGATDEREQLRDLAVVAE